MSTAEDALRAAFLRELEGFSGRASIAYQGLTGAAPAGRGRVAIDADAPMPSTSLIKLAILGCALQAAEDGELDLDRRVALRPEHVVGGNGVLRLLRPGLELTVDDLLTLMIVVSDNTATNLAIDLLGEARIGTWIRDAGLAGTALVGKLQLPEERWNEAQRRGERNRTCAADVLGLLLALERGELLPPRASERMRSILSGQLYTEGIGRRLPIDPEVPDARGRAVRLESKSGCLAGVWHDAAIVRRLDGTPLFALAVLTADAADRAEHWRQEGLLRIAAVARRAFEAATGEAPSAGR